MDTFKGCLKFLVALAMIAFGLSVIGGLLYFDFKDVIEYAERPQATMRVRLEAFTLSKGYYVVLSNESSFEVLNTRIEYVIKGRPRVAQDVGSLKKGETIRIDPSNVGWTIDRDQEIHFSTSNTQGGYWETTKLFK